MGNPPPARHDTGPCRPDHDRDRPGGGGICGSLLRDSRDRAVIPSGFSAALWRSEIVALDVMYLAISDEGIRLTVSRSKTDQEAAGEIVGIVRIGSATCPVCAVQDWLSAAGIRHGAAFRLSLPPAATRCAPACRPASPRTMSGCSRPPHAASQSRAVRIRAERSDHRPAHQTDQSRLQRVLVVGTSDRGGRRHSSYRLDS